ncbi:MAG: ABC transporter ATP-binding protein, partial [Pseudomonadota bacterium]
EPMEGLDPHARILLKALLRGYRAQGKSVFMSSHILTDMEELCDRIAVLHGGRLVFTGPPSGLLRQYGAPDFEMAFLAAITPDDRQ